ncbi:MAG: DUF503 domain-containing protein [Pseudomonadota bacterium]
MLNTACMTVSFYLHGCRSLKEKRQRLGRIKDKFARHANLALCESGHNDEHHRGEWSFVGVAGSAVVVEQILGDVERYLLASIDAEIVDLKRVWLS